MGAQLKRILFNLSAYLHSEKSFATDLCIGHDSQLRNTFLLGVHQSSACKDRTIIFYFADFTDRVDL